MPFALDDLPAAAMAIVLTLMPLEDLLRLSRASRRYHTIVAEAEGAWHSLYEAQFEAEPSAQGGAQARGTAVSGRSSSWRERFRARCASSGRS